MDAYKDSIFEKGVQHRGVAFIISMEKGREGGARDTGRLECLAKFLHFDPITVVDKTADDLRREIVQCTRSPALQGHDFFLCFVNAHGRTHNNRPFIEDASDGSDRLYVLEDIVEPFASCKFLFGKPKVFFINACRGPHNLACTTPRGAEPGRDPSLQSNATVKAFLETRRHIFVMFSTDEGDKSWRTVDGTVFVSVLCDTFFRHSDSKQLDDIAKIVSDEVAERWQTLRNAGPRAGISMVSQNCVLMSSLAKRVEWRRHDPKNADDGKMFPPTQVAEHVLLLYDSLKDKREYNRASLVDVMFFHSYEFESSMVAGYPAAMSSWVTKSRYRENQLFWPVDWLPGSDGLGLPLRIFSVTYNGLEIQPRACDTKRHLQSTAQNLQQELFLLQDKLGLGQGRALVFVGHALGGFLIKSILNSRNCDDTGKLQILRDHLIGIAFYGVPCIPRDLSVNSASVPFSIRGLENGLEKENGVNALMEMDELKDTLLNPKELFDAHKDFERMRGRGKAFLEQQDTYGMKIAEPIIPGEFPKEIPIKANHFDICRPSSKGDNNFVFLVHFITRQYKLYTSNRLTGYQPEVFRSQEAFIVGQQKYFEDLKKSVLSNEGKHILGITGGTVYGVFGMGGIGKTTLANSLQNDEDIQRHFSDRVYFVSIKKEPRISDIQASLKYQICKEMPGTQIEDVLRVQLQTELRALPKFLLFLDDVWDKKHVDRLLGESFISALPKGSRCIITTRLKSELSKFNASLTVEVDLLSGEASRKLFCYHAFPGHTEVPTDIPRQLVNVVEEVITACDGLPLILVAIGEERRGKLSIETWKAARDKLKNVKAYALDPYDKAIESVKVSYDALPEYYMDTNLKDMFIDFAAFPDREEIEICSIMDLWKRQGLGEKVALAYLEQLEDRCMLKVTGYWCYVHDIFRSMAIKLIETGPANKWKRLFAWGPMDRLPPKWTSCLPAGGGEMRAGSTQHGLWGSLSWLLAAIMNCLFTWEGDCTAESFSCEKLVISRTMVRRFDSVDCQLFAHLGQLRTLVLAANFSLDRLPAEIGGLKMLERLDLSWCFALESLPEEVGQLSQLKKLNLAGCVTLAGLPPSIGSLLELTDLDLRSTGIVELPVEIGQLKKLKSLNLKDANKLQVLPPQIGQLQALKTLDAALTQISEVPRELGQLVNLKTLMLEGCGRIKELPRELGGLKNLRTLNCINSRNLKIVPQDLDRLVTEGKLRHFNVYNTAVDRHLLPDGLRGLPEPFSGRVGDGQALSAASEAGSSSQWHTLDKTASKRRFYLSLFAAGTKEDRRAAFGLSHMVRLAQLETFNSAKMKTAIRMIYTMANDHSTRHTVIKNGGLPVLLRCLLEGEPDVASHAAAALCNICVSGTTVDDVLAAGGLRIICYCINRRGAAGFSATEALKWILEIKNSEDCVRQAIHLLGHDNSGRRCSCGYCYYAAQRGR